MLVTPNQHGWSSSTEGPWQLIFNDQYIIKLFRAGLGTTTQEKLFVGTKEQCEAKIAELGLPLASNNSLGEVEYQPNVVPPPLDEFI